MADMPKGGVPAGAGGAGAKVGKDPSLEGKMSEEIAQILLPNLGSASACPYYIDLSVRIIVSS